MKKRILAIALALVMILSLGSGAFAAEAEYTTTAQFIDEMSEVDGITCENQGLTTFGADEETMYESVYVSYQGELSKYASNINILFNKDADEVIAYMNDLITFDASNMEKVLDDVNYLNASTVGVKLFVNTERNTVCAEMYNLTTPESSVSVAEMSFFFLMSFTDVVYEYMEAYRV